MIRYIQSYTTNIDFHQVFSRLKLTLFDLKNSFPLLNAFRVLLILVTISLLLFPSIVPSRITSFFICLYSFVRSRFLYFSVYFNLIVLNFLDHNFKDFLKLIGHLQQFFYNLHMFCVVDS